MRTPFVDSILQAKSSTPDAEDTSVRLGVGADHLQSAAD
jgi:hypothetical protein